MTRRHGRAPKGRRVHGAVPGGHWQVTTLLGALALDGVRAAMTVDSATDADVFVAFVGRVLVPSVRAGDVVVWDNLPPHKAVAAARALRQARVTVRFLPPYSPDFNPIEPCWSKVKEVLRGAQPRTRAALDHMVAEALRQVTASDARGWFGHCGYRVTPT